MSKASSSRYRSCVNSIAAMEKRNLLCVLVCVMFGTVDVKTFKCGTTDFPGGLITKGTKTERGEWPFLTALYRGEKFTFFCGGSLISEKHVLTAAHCIQQKNSRLKLLPVDIVVLLGAYDLTLSNETEVLKRNVNDIYIHPDWDVYGSKYDADLAILSLNETVLFTDYIRQVCMPADNTVIDGARGSVAGWGLTENRTGLHLVFTKHAFVRVTNDSYCYTKDHIVASMSSNRTFCGQGEDGSPNLGDSGGGFFIHLNSSWVQHGIVSVFRSDAIGNVDPNSIVVYTNVILYKSWITEIVTESGGTVDEAKITPDIKINLKCHYGYTSAETSTETSMYGCWLYDLDLQGDNFAVASFTGVHDYLKTDQDVKVIQFHKGTMIFPPVEIGKVFKNLTHFVINEGLRTKLISRSHLKNLENMISLRIVKNDIDTLDKYALWDLPNLEIFAIHHNNLKEINVKTFEKNLKLIDIILISNQLTFLPRNLFQNNFIFEFLDVSYNNLNVIDESIFATNGKLNHIDLSSNQFDALPVNLLKYNPLLANMNLSHNSINEIDGDFFQHNSVLEFVDLSHNSLKVIDEHTFAMNEKLKQVYLHSNQIEVLPRYLFKNNSLLKAVNLEHNILKVIDEKIFATNEKLVAVSLFSNKLELLHRDLLKNNPLLAYMNLAHNSIKVIDEDFFQNNYFLKDVDLGHNQLKALPRIFLKNNPFLKLFYLEHNSINEIDGDFFQNNSILELVDLSYNSLKVIDENIFAMNEKLKKVFLHSNQLEILPRYLFKNNSLLEVVNLEENNLNEIDENIFATNGKLVAVSLLANKLELLHRNLFKNNLLLKVASPSNNSIGVIHSSTFETNEKLEIIQLSFNKIELLPSNLFQSNSLLEHVEFRDNLLRVIEIDFIGFKNIALIDFYGNICIDAYYKDGSKYLNVIKNLTEFQSLIRVNCSSLDP